MADDTPTLTVFRTDAVELPSLVVVASPPRGKSLRVPLGVTPLSIGSSPECDVVLDDPGVSRRHAEISLTARGVWLRDLGSKNGTLLGDTPILEVLLPLKKKVTLGTSTLAVIVAGAPQWLALSTAARFGEAVGAAVSMRALFAVLERAAASAETILLLGESGTGKELLARAIHDQSPRAGGPFVVFDCGAVAPGLVEAELFGYLRGAFTGASAPRAGLFEQAHGGTIFIDEIGELPLEVQPKLLRALEAREVRRLGATAPTPVDARVIAATHRDLHGRVTAGSFRADLYYRLAVVEALVPPLRDRKEDIPLLVERFLAAQTPPRSLDHLPPHALDLLRGHHYPGNVRELRNLVARLLLFPELGEAAFAQLSPHSTPAPAQPAAADADLPAAMAHLRRLPLREAREAVVAGFERAYIAAKLRDHGGAVTRAAESMGVSRQFLHRMMVRYGVRGGGEEIPESVASTPRSRVPPEG